MAGGEDVDKSGNERIYVTISDYKRQMCGYAPSLKHLLDLSVVYTSKTPVFPSFLLFSCILCN